MVRDRELKSHEVAIPRGQKMEGGKNLSASVRRLGLIERTLGTYAICV